MNGEQQWQNVKEGYLRQIEKSLAKTDHPRRAEILSDVKDHLDRKYAELPPAERNWEGYQRIITEMGPPEDYAELLKEERTEERSRFGINELLAIIFVATLIAIGIYLVYTAKTTAPAEPGYQRRPSHLFQTDLRLTGKWIAVDFVEKIEEFAPAKRSWPENLFLRELQFYADGTLAAKDIEKEYVGFWTKGAVSPDSKRPALYEIRNIEEKEYLFYEWISGDVTIRGQKPYYYVLRKAD
jgi:hypothetical protein